LRKSLIVGNWKMNKTINEAILLTNQLIPLVKKSDAEVVICPTSICLADVVRAVTNTNIKVGAQNMYYKESGAFTGEISPLSLMKLGVEYVILGHSERRQYFNESNEDINKKVISALSTGLMPILCVGETLEERESGKAFDVISKQISECLKNVECLKLEGLVIAYEPIWAIGTGKTATKEDANEIIMYIRKLITEKLSKSIAENIRILYGGSVKSSNIKELMAMSDIDGALVGGASLEAVEFSNIVKY